MKIGIIDSGVEATHRRLKKIKITDGIFFEPDQNSSNITDYCGHGTAITSIISQIVPKAELYIAKIFNTRLVTEEKIMIKAIEWCITEQVDIINLSVGIQTENPSNDLYNVCLKAYEKNIIIIAAAYYLLAKPCYPAFFPYVFGVTEGRVSDSFEFGTLPNYPIDFVAKGDIHRVAHINDSFTFASGTSYACAYFTGVVANYKLNNPNFEKFDEIKINLIAQANLKILPAQSKQIKDIPYVIRTDVDTIAEKILNKTQLTQDLGRLALFPISEKEMNSFLDFPKHSIVPISMFIDYPRSFKVKNGEIDIQDWMVNEIDLEKFDTLVLGYFFENFLYTNQKFGFELTQRSILQHKNIYVFDHKLIKYIKTHSEYHGNLYCPEIRQSTAQDILQFQNFPQIKVPVIAVVGTSNKQGKFTTQLRLKEILTNEGYQVSHISTEPQGELLGADFTFPIGLNSTVQIPPHTWDVTINALVKAIAFYKKPHIIIGGTQGWTIPLNIDLTNTLNTLHFLNGLQPDVFICAINPNDSIEEINRNIQAIQTVTKAKVLFYTITPWERKIEKTTTGNNILTKNLLSDNELQQKIAFYSKILNKPVINIKDKNNDSLIISIIEEIFS